MTPQAALARGLGELGFELPAQASGQLLKFVQLLEKWNNTYNLTAVREPLKMVSHHLLDSLVVVPHLGLEDGAALVDVGSGAGLPGIPLAIARPSWRVTVNDASEKKAAFMRQAAIELGLDNVAVHAGRVEQWRPQERFALVISRAFAGLGDFIAACRHIVSPGGVLAAMKGALSDDELATAPPQCTCRVVALQVPLLDARRHLVLCSPAG